MTDWIEHNGGPQPVADDVWVEVLYPGTVSPRLKRARWPAWRETTHYRILNQHLIDAARREGIRLGLEAAHKAIVALDDVVDEAERSVLEDASMAVCAIDPDTIAKEADQ